MSNPLADSSTVTAVAYLRVSQDATGEELAVSRQLAAIEELAAREGNEITHTYADNDVSAYSGKIRPAYEQMRKDARAGKFDVIYVWSQDRITRQPKELEALIEDLDAGRVAVRSVMGGRITLDSSEGRLTARLMGSIAAMESERKSERIIAKNQQRATVEKLTPSSIRPFGFEYTSTANVFTVHPVEGPAVAEMYRRFNSGDSLRSIGHWLNSEGLLGTKGTEWTSGKVRRTLASARNAGLLAYKGSVLGESKNPAIVSREVFETTAALLDNPARTKRGRPHVTLFGGLGLLKCGVCGKSLTNSSARRPSGREYVYACNDANARCVTRKAETVDNTVLLTVDTYLESIAPELHAAAAKSASNLHTEEIAALEARISALSELVASGSLAPADYALSVAAVRKRLDRLTEQASSITDAYGATRTVTGLGKSLLSLPLATQRAVLAELIECVTIKPGRNIEAIDITWKNSR